MPCPLFALAAMMPATAVPCGSMPVDSGCDAADQDEVDLGGGELLLERGLVGRRDEVAGRAADQHADRPQFVAGAVHRRFQHRIVAHVGRDGAHLGAERAQLDLVIHDRFGHPVKPREWFLVPLPAIDEAVQHIRDGTITDFHYDPKLARFVGHAR